jgi:hypothetical protein
MNGKKFKTAIRSFTVRPDPLPTTLNVISLSATLVKPKSGLLGPYRAKDHAGGGARAKSNEPEKQMTSRTSAISLRTYALAHTMRKRC